MIIIFLDSKYVRENEVKYVEVCSHCENIDWFISDLQNALNIRMTYLERDKDIKGLYESGSIAVEILRDVLEQANHILKGK